MTSDPLTVLREHTLAAAADPASDIVWAGEHEGRWGIRMAQTVRDFTTVWFDAGERTLGFEAFVSPTAPHGREEIYRQCLRRNHGTLHAAFALDAQGDLILRGKVPNSLVDAGTIDTVIGEIYDLVEVAFRPIVRIGFGTRETNP